jgi:hypothetical protein
MPVSWLDLIGRVAKQDASNERDSRATTIPKLDDTVLLEALKSPAFHIGALGSRVNTAKRRERLALFDL